MAIRAIRNSDVFVPYGRSAHPSTKKESLCGHRTHHAQLLSMLTQSSRPHHETAAPATHFVTSGHIDPHGSARYVDGTRRLPISPLID
eukprot:1941658-Prymnesium_polylepis.1